jgi:hypothetical protein
MNRSAIGVANVIAMVTMMAFAGLAAAAKIDWARA